jgi:hypothetical protein
MASRTLYNAQGSFVSTSSAVLLDVGCSFRVRAATQAIVPDARLTPLDVHAIADQEPIILNQAHAVVLGVRTRLGAPSTSIIERLREIAPHVGIFVVEERHEIIDPWLRRLAVSGADDAFAIDRIGDEEILRSVIASRVALPPPELQLKRFWSHWTVCPLRVEAMYCVRNGYKPRHRFAPHPWFGLKPRAMRIRFEHVGLPTPLFLTRFGRDLHWNEALEHGTRSRIELATLLGFETVTQLGVERRRVRKQTGRWPYLSALLDLR